jgi:hypothetical protein
MYVCMYQWHVLVHGHGCQNRSLTLHSRAELLAEHSKFSANILTNVC